MLKISNFFYDHELQCKCGKCERVDADPRTLMQLDRLRIMMDRPLNVRSWHRCKDHNKAVGGASNSQHLGVNALDIETKGWSGEDLFWFVEFAKSFFNGIIIYSDFVHIDKRSDPLLKRGDY